MVKNYHCIFIPQFRKWFYQRFILTSSLNLVPFCKEYMQRSSGILWRKSLQTVFVFSNNFTLKNAVLTFLFVIHTLSLKYMLWVYIRPKKNNFWYWQKRKDATNQYNVFLTNSYLIKGSKSIETWWNCYKIVRILFLEATL